MNPKPNRQLNAVEKAVGSSLRRVNRKYLRLGQKSAKWTRAVKNEVGKVGEKRGYKVYGSACQFWRNGEWLLDLVWSREDEVFTFRLPLVMESEWDPADIVSDFAKLVVVRADLRLMVFWDSTVERADKSVKKMLTQIQRFHGTRAGDRYLFCYWTDRPDKMFVKSYVVKARPNPPFQATAERLGRT